MNNIITDKVISQDKPIFVVTLKTSECEYHYNSACDDIDVIEVNEYVFTNDASNYLACDNLLSIVPLKLCPNEIYLAYKDLFNWMSEFELANF